MDAKITVFQPMNLPGFPALVGVMRYVATAIAISVGITRWDALQHFTG